MRDCVSEQVPFEVGPEDQSFDVARYDLHLFGEVTDKLYTAYCAAMLVTDRLAMLRPNISKDVVLSLQQEVFRVLPRYMVVLCQQAFDLVQHNLALHMPRHDVNVLIYTQSLYVEASHRTLLDLLVLQHCYLLL